MLLPETISRITRYLEAGMPPRIESVLGDAHVFGWTTDDLEDADFVLINRNGNIGRAYQNSMGWHLVKGMGKADIGPFNFQSWEVTNNNIPSLREAAQKMWLPDQETLSFLPKQLTPPKSRRLLIHRDQLFRFITAANMDGFKLQVPGGAESPVFQGKPWESREAALWANRYSDGDDDAPVSAEAALAQVAFAGVQEKAEVGLDGLWGMF